MKPPLMIQATKLFFLKLWGLTFPLLSPNPKSSNSGVTCPAHSTCQSQSRRGCPAGFSEQPQPGWGSRSLAPGSAGDKAAATTHLAFWEADAQHPHAGRG